MDNKDVAVFLKLMMEIKDALHEIAFSVGNISKNSTDMLIALKDISNKK